MSGARILITGAAGGIGGATARRLARNGARLVLADLPGEALDRLTAELRSCGSDAFTVPFDAMDGLTCSALPGGAVELLGGLDAVCAIAGIYRKAHFTDVTPSDWARIMQVNLTATFLVAQAAMPHLIASGGTLVTTGSLAALNGQPYGAPYAASKAAIVALTMSLAAEYAAVGVRVNCVSPGGVRTGMAAGGPLPDADPDLGFRRSKLKGFDGFGGPEDIAEAFAWLVSDRARFVSGSNLVVDGAQRLV